MVDQRTDSSRRGARRTSVVVALATSVLAALVSACSLTTPTTVNLARTADGDVTGVIGVGADPTIATIQVRLTSGTGKAVVVRPTQTYGAPAEDQRPVTVTDDFTWTSVSPVHPVGVHPGILLPTEIALRFTMPSATPFALRLELRGLNPSGAPSGLTWVTPVTGADCGSLTPFTDQTAVDLVGKDLHNCTIPGVTLTAAQLSGGWVSGADLRGATILPGTVHDVDLSGVLFAPATLADVTFGAAPNGYVRFWGADLTGAILTGANLHRSDLTGADLTGANLTNADLAGANLTGTIGTPTYDGALFNDTVCPDGTLSTAHGQTCQGHPWP